jgi:hypothetical protein
MPPRMCKFEFDQPWSHYAFACHIVDEGLILVYALQLCSTIRNVIDQSSLLVYRQELAAANMIDGQSSLSSAARLKKLEETEQAWSRLVWRRKDIIRLDVPYGSSHLNRVHGKYVSKLVLRARTSVQD